jgi:acetyl esterase
VIAAESLPSNMEPNKEVQALIGALDVPMDQTIPITPTGIREAFAQFVKDINERGEIEEVSLIVDEFVSGSGGDIPVRRYEPTGRADDRFDVAVFFHGGGWVAGDLETADAVSRVLAVGLQCTVVSADYRCAPEDPFPAAYDDCLDVVRHFQRQSSTRSVLVIGESAGGNLAAAVALATRNDAKQLAGQVLINPVLDLIRESPSYERLGVGYGLRANDMRSYAEWYIADGDRRDIRVSPLLASSFKGVAPAVVVTAGFDPLHDEGISYVESLVRDDIPVVSLPMPTMLHGWWSLLPVSEEARRQSSRLLNAIKFIQSLPSDGKS